MKCSPFQILIYEFVFCYVRSFWVKRLHIFSNPNFCPNSVLSQPNTFIEKCFLDASQSTNQLILRHGGFDFQFDPDHGS